MSFRMSMLACLRPVFVVSALLASLACDRPSARTAPETAATAPSLGADSPAKAATDSPAEYLYVSAEQSGEVVVVDPIAAKVRTRIPVGKRPRGLALSSDKKLLYVATSGSPRAGPGVDEAKLPAADRTADGIAVVDVARAQLLRTLPGGQDPESFALTRDGSALYIANEETAELSRLDLDKGEVTQRTKVSEQPEGVAVAPDGSVVYVTCEQDNEVVAVDTTSAKAIAHIPVGKRPRAIAFNQDASLAFVTNELDASISVIDTQKLAVVASISLAQPGLDTPRPMGIIRAANGKRMFVSTGRGGGIAEIDVPSRTLTRHFHKVGARPWGIAQSPDGKRLYTANGPSGDITILELESGKQSHVAIGGSPWGVVAASR